MARQARFGPSEPLHIYQDDFYENSAPMISHATMPPAPQTHRRPLQSANGNVILNPPAVSGVKISPFKSDMQTGSQLMPLSAPGNRLNMMSMMPPSMMPPSMMPPNHMSHPTDNLEKKQPVMSKFRTGGHKAGSECGMPKYYNKENMHPVLYPAPLGMAFYPQPEEYVGRSSGKRSLLEAAPIKELRPAKKMRLDEQVLPAPDSFPLIFDDGTKPGHSYATLIGMAILRSPQRRLTLAQIYKWISDTYSFYNPNDAGWQNSIRHNLSLNKNFVKQERPKDDPGKGNYWAIEQGAEHLFMKEKPTRKTVNSPENVSVMSTRLEPANQHIPLMPELILQHQAPVSQASLPALPASSQPAPTSIPAEVSSDATIPQSELAVSEEVPEKGCSLETVHETPEHDVCSPSAPAMHSSPPIPQHLDAHHDDTPPSMQRAHGSSASKTNVHKRKHASMDDSGYISSLESSAMRPDKRAKLLTSEPDRPRIKRGGRAEDEIVRLRASSFESPTKGRSFAYPPPSSSPWRRNNEGGQMLPPLTPATKLEAPPKPPPSVSPNTNLRLHRESVQSMLDSPERRADFLLPRDASLFAFTPGLSLDDIFDGLPRHGDSVHDFDIFQDPFMPITNMSPAVALTGSPIKRSAKKPRIDRSHSYDGCNTACSVLAAAPQLKAPGHTPSVMFDTPSKIFDDLPSSPSKMFTQSPSKIFHGNQENIAPWFSMDELCGDDILEDNDFAGFDMLGNFEKIGSVASTQMSRAARSSQKPALNRSYTSTF